MANSFIIHQEMKRKEKKRKSIYLPPSIRYITAGVAAPPLFDCITKKWPIALYLCTFYLIIICHHHSHHEFFY